jgi:hypothetical protein
MSLFYFREENFEWRFYVCVRHLSFYKKCFFIYVKDLHSRAEGGGPEVSQSQLCQTLLEGPLH